MMSEYTDQCSVRIYYTYTYNCMVCKLYNQINLWKLIGLGSDTFCYRLLLGQRPYWWVHVSSRWPNDQAIHQVYITCETGPGMYKVDMQYSFVGVLSMQAYMRACVCVRVRVWDLQC